MLPLRLAATIKTENPVAGWWQEQGALKKLPGALWATLTHPRCTEALEYQVLGQVHMIQHRVVMASQMELAWFEAVIDDNAVLARELAGTRQQSARQAAEHSGELDALQTEVVRLRGQVMAAQGMSVALRQGLHHLCATMPDPGTRQALAERNAQHEDRVRLLLRAL
jgi:hypothetical protein